MPLLAPSAAAAPHLEQVAKVVAAVEGDPADVVVQHDAAAHQQLAKVLHVNAARLILQEQQQQQHHGTQENGGVSSKAQQLLVRQRRLKRCMRQICQPIWTA